MIRGSVRIGLRVFEGLQKDANRFIARIDPEIMEQYNISVGDVIEIEGRKKTAAKVWNGLQEDRGKRAIRLSPIVRKNAGISLNEIVRICKTEPRIAGFVALAPVGMYIEPNSHLVEFIKNKLKNAIFVEGNFLQIYIADQSIMLKVMDTRPSGVVVTVTESTQIQIYEKPSEVEKQTLLTWEDIGGLDEAKQKIRELVELPLRHPELFKHLGVEPPKGILLFGPPGAGKTLLARVTANEANAYFITINGPEIMSKYYGESEAKLREIFEEARRNAPAIIFIDEIDAIAPKREGAIGETEKRVVAQLLALMDGLKVRGQIIVMGATNRPEAVDPALRRPGRFDREIWINPPDFRGRHEILQIHTRDMPLEPDVDLRKLAEMTHGYSGADIAALAKEAAIRAVRRVIQKGLVDLEASTPIPPQSLEKVTVAMQDFLDAMRDIVPSALREIHVEVPRVKWEDIGGLDEVKQKLREAIEWPLKYPDKFEKFGLRPPKGILLFGPPGTGKTLLAKAVATESGANFIAVRGPEIFSKWVGESEKMVREIFQKARMAAPCVVFFDEIDAIAPARGHDSSAVAERVVAQLLAEMDGVKSLEGVVVVGATNRPDLVDPALLRPGRLDYSIYVPPPDFDARLDIFKIHTRNVPLAKDVDLEELARRTEGYSGADIELVIREAIYSALRENAEEAAMRHFEDALQSIAPSIMPDMLKSYEGWLERTGRRVKKKAVYEAPRR